MPWYDFECPECGKKFEKSVLVDQRHSLCECGQVAHRLFPAPTFRVNGYSAKNNYSKTS